MTAGSCASWSPYAAGLGIGALEWLAFATVKRGLGVTKPFETAAVIVQQRVAPRRSHVNRFLKEREEPPSIDWEVALAGGIVLGSFLASRGSTETSERVPDLWAARFGPSVARRYAAAFAGGALMMLGARTAQGCTSGHGITGGLQLAASSWLFTAVMGASAAVTASLLFGRR